MARVRGLDQKTEELVAETREQGELAKTRCQHVEDGRVYVEGAQAEIKKFQEAATRNSQTLETSVATASAELQKIKSTLTTSEELSGKINTISASVAEPKAQAESHTAITKDLTDIAQRTRIALEQYEKRLDELLKEGEARLAEIDSLLPGATSTGLAEAFRSRKLVFARPQILLAAASRKGTTAAP